MLKSHAVLSVFPTYSTESKVVKKQHTRRSHVHQSVHFDRQISPPCDGPQRGRTPGRSHGTGPPGLRRAAYRVRAWRHFRVHRERRRPTIASSPSAVPIADASLGCRAPPVAKTLGQPPFAVPSDRPSEHLPCRWWTRTFTALSNLETPLRQSAGTEADECSGHRTQSSLGGLDHDVFLRHIDVTVGQ